MNSLRELQLDFSQGIFDNSRLDFCRHIRANGLPPERRLQIYRNNTFASLTEALRQTYPVTQRLVGEGFFRYAAAQYISQYPSVSGDLHDFGGSFPDFLKGFEPASSLAYLPDLAELEWACDRVFYQADHLPLDTVALAGVPEGSQGALKFELHPACRLLASDYPLLRIWQVNQENYRGDPSVDLSEGGVRLLIMRPRLEVEIQALQEGDFMLLKTLSEGIDFATACDRALAAQPDFDLPTSFRRHLQQATLVDFFV